MEAIVNLCDDVRATAALPMYPSKEILRITVSRTYDGAADGEIVTVGHSGSRRRAAAIVIAANLELPACVPHFPPPSYSHAYGHVLPRRHGLI